MKSKLIAALIVGSFVLAGCGGGSSDSAMDEEMQVADQERIDELEEELEEAQEEAAEAERQRQAAERLRQAAEAQRQQAEADRQRLEDEAEERRKADAAERARTAIAGSRAIGDSATLVADTPEYGAPAVVTTPPGPFTRTTGRSGRWSTTSLTANAEPTRDTIQIYSDVEAPTRSPFATSDYKSDNDENSDVIDTTGRVVGHVDIDNATSQTQLGHSRVATSGSFPTDIGPAEPFRLVDRGLNESEYTGLNLPDDGMATDTELETARITRQQYNQYRAERGFRDTDRFPRRYAYTTSGFLQGASGTYRCNGADATAACTVQNRGGSFEFDGEWEFIPSSGTVRIVVPDGQYMWFGWWARQTVRHLPDNHPTEIWAFEAKHGGNAVTTFTDATGTATYEGPAAGRYAIFEPDTGDSGIGSFTASATLVADFDSDPNTVSGMITGFSNDPGWSLALKRGNIANGKIAAADDTVTWTIDGVPVDNGQWEAAFYANLPVTGDTIDYQPHGIAGTFEAEYDASGEGPTAALIGAFGAHR